MAVTVPAVKAAILALLQANTWPTASPDCRWGGPTESEDQTRGGELVYFADVRELGETLRAFGSERVDEAYTLRIHIDVRWDGDDEQGAETRAWALYDSMRRLLHVNHALITNPGTMVVYLVAFADGEADSASARTVTSTNVAIPSGWVSRIQVDQAVTGWVDNP